MEAAQSFEIIQNGQPCPAITRQKHEGGILSDGGEDAQVLVFMKLVQEPRLCVLMGQDMLYLLT